MSQRCTHLANPPSSFKDRDLVLLPSLDRRRVHREAPEVVKSEHADCDEDWDAGSVAGETRISFCVRDSSEFSTHLRMSMTTCVTDGSDCRAAARSALSTCSRRTKRTHHESPSTKSAARNHPQVVRARHVHRTQEPDEVSIVRMPNAALNQHRTQAVPLESAPVINPRTCDASAPSPLFAWSSSQ